MPQGRAEDVDRVRLGLQVLLGVLGAVAVVFGLLGVIAGTAAIPGGDGAGASVDSELRFHAAWYAGAGLLLLRAIPRVERETFIVRWAGAMLWLAALGRALSIAAEGRPAPRFVALLVAEIAIPLVIVPWQAAVARRHRA